MHTHAHKHTHVCFSKEHWLTHQELMKSKLAAPHLGALLPEAWEHPSNRHYCLIVGRTPKSIPDVNGDWKFREGQVVNLLPSSAVLRALPFPRSKDMLHLDYCVFKDRG